MLTSYLRSAFRSLLRDRVAAAINVVGLAIAIAACIAVYLFLQVYYTLDTGHANADRIVMAERVERRGDAPATWGTTPRGLGPALAADLPQVEQAVRTVSAEADVRTASASFEERVRLADPGFFDVFTFPLEAGAKDALRDPGSAVLGAEAARKFFGDADPLSRRLIVDLGDGAPRVVTVAAVAAPFPDNASLRFDVLLPLPEERLGASDWAASDVATFLLLRRPGDLATVEAQMGRYVSRLNEADPEARVERIVFERLTAPAAGAVDVRQRATEAPDPILTALLVGLAVLMLFLACVNYVNVALGTAARRVKEIGVRKAIGAGRGQIVAQFMAENLVLCTVALALGVVLAQAALVPLFNTLFVIDVSLTSDARLWAFLGALLVVVSVASGIYPALYVAGLQPSRIFQGTARLSSRNTLTRALSTAQFCVAFVAVLACVVLALNGRYLTRQGVGYDPEGVVAVKLSNPEAFPAMRDAASGLSGVVRVAGTTDHIGASIGRTRFTVGDDTTQHEALALAVGSGYAETMGLRLERGRLFDEHLASDTASAVVNARFALERGVDVGQTLRIDRQDVTVVGVVDDFLYDPVVSAQAVVLRASAEAPRWLAVRVVPGRESAVRSALAAAWARRVPDAPFEAFTQREVFEDQLGAYANLSRALAALAGLALLIACMGVFGLATQNVARRRKEVSVRKVLGASVAGLVVLVNRPFLTTLAIAGGLGTVAGVVALRLVIGLDALNLMPITPLPFVVAFALVLIPVALSVASQSRALVRSNLADVLRGD